MIKLSVSETKWSSLLARTRALILYILIWIFDFGPVKLPGLSRNGPLVKRHGLIPFKAIVVTSMKFLELQNTLLLPNCILKRGRDVDTIPITRFFYRSSSRKQALYEHQPVALFNSSSPNISMSILHTVLYKFPVVLIRICLTRKTFFHLLINFHFSSWSLCSI